MIFWSIQLAPAPDTKQWQTAATFRHWAKWNLYGKEKDQSTKKRPFQNGQVKNLP